MNRVTPGKQNSKRRPVAATQTATLDFEAKLWLAADKLRNNMDAAEYKHVVLGLIFLKYISDSFEEHRAKLIAGKGDYAGADPEDPDEYRAENIFWVPKEARWSHLQANAKQPTIGKFEDDAMVAIERDNSRLKGLLPKDYARPALDKHRLGELIDLVGTILLISPKQTLFIDARRLGTLIDRVHRELTDADIAKIVSTYHVWRGEGSGSARVPRAVSGVLAGNSPSLGEAAIPKSSARATTTTCEGTGAPHYSDTPGFCKSATTAEIAAHGYVLTPGRYVGAEEVEDDGEPFEEKFPRLASELEAQFAESAKLETAIRQKLKSLRA